MLCLHPEALAKPLQALHSCKGQRETDCGTRSAPCHSIDWKYQLVYQRGLEAVTLYDLKNGFFIPNERKKYSVGKNAAMKLDESGGIEIYVAAKKPEGVPEENWLTINRNDEDMDIVLRAYVPELEKMKTWTAPKAEKLNN